MKIVVVGGTGLIGSKLVGKLREHGHDAVSASPDSGVNTVTGEGLEQALKGASVVVDVSNSPSFEEDVATSFFTTSTRNLLEHEEAAGVSHHVALSVVGTDRLAARRPTDPPASIRGYFTAKLRQETMIRESPIPWTIVRATQFFEFIKTIADVATVDGTVRIGSVLVQPMAADDIAKAVGKVAVGPPQNAIVEIAGPEQFHLDQLVRTWLDARSDSRRVVADPDAGYFKVRVDERTLVPSGEPRIAETRLDQWLTMPMPAR